MRGLSAPLVGAVISWTVGWTVGCDERCPTAGDGVCDEPASCVLGTDEQDCAAACEAGDDLFLIGAACAFREPVAEPEDDGDGSGGASHQTGWSDDTVTVPDGEWLPSNVRRHYRLYLPSSYDPDRSTPLVLMLPGHRVSHYSLASYTELPRTAEEYGFIVADCEQQYRWSGEHRWAWFTDWSWDDAPDTNPDLDYLRAVIDQIADGYNVDRRRVFLAGHSRGAAMAFIGALELADVVAGACIQSGFTEYDYLDDRLSSWDGRKVPLYFMHGQDDPDVSVSYADAMVERIVELGWVEGEDYVYRRLSNVTHRYQPWLNSIWYEFLRDRPLPEGS